MRPNRLPSETLMWLIRAEQARRVAGMLSGEDAKRAWAYAKECEDHAMDTVLTPLAA
jgi:hypothetical protein